jgi:hypothetical protein
MEATVAKKKTGRKQIIGTSEGKGVRHARIELPDDDYQRLKAVAVRYRISVAAYIRLAVMERIERDEGKR